MRNLSVRKYKKLGSLIQKVVKRNTTNISQKEYDNVNMEHGEIAKEYIPPKGNYITLDEV